MANAESTTTASAVSSIVAKKQNIDKLLWDCIRKEEGEAEKLRASVIFLLRKKLNIRFGFANYALKLPEAKVMRRLRMVARKKIWPKMRHKFKEGNRSRWPLITFLLACFHFIWNAYKSIHKNIICVYTNMLEAAASGNSMISSLDFSVWLCSIQVFINHVFACSFNVCSAVLLCF